MKYKENISVNLLDIDGAQISNTNLRFTQIHIRIAIRKNLDEEA